MSTSRKNGSRHATGTALKPQSKRVGTPMRTASEPTAPTIKSGPSSQLRTEMAQGRTKPVEISRQAIAEAAYFLWLRRGGSEQANWLEAEAMLKSRAAG